ncbi:major capsid protein [Spodoptera frugiperda multiple nucleopolyhedrovirus]|uniref:Major capsid protein n=1 Tax=Spodoptera frugiperda nuclear polyhedrosis virus TaxID=10455 RepID=A1YJ67_NPVSF|nr:major capsid protein [Spodoptera frugiperda multiple nucleopolyhedrovirus]ABM45787.1 major capsid protein [Spodoptera frugiperda multiple nucleopolyhedrovirus]ACA02634.1 VP39 [Spodoptera frugiperda multiple nucleopolyhedrovirus]ADV91310.1 vp39 [Spodoptera frugiperda multiple nucleopolyhedrovirus]AFH59020.1 vp39 [Spodoptera frugiperda multiple nucleopolyhedrovirus]AIW01487.1 VP39 protein [Spodoptera frugiperda multiple nucleopolyhedrovirus]
MALTPISSTATKRNNFCIFGAVQSFDPCYTYTKTCSPDAAFDDGWYICEYHASIRFKIEKMVMPIPDGEGRTYYRTVGKSLVSDKAEGSERILIPTADNYETVLNINAMSLPEQLIFHMIYKNREKQERVCQMLQFNEHFQTEIYKIINSVYNNTRNVLAMTDPTQYCSRVSQNSTRVYGVNDENDIAEQTINRMPGFLQNLINKCVAPQTMNIENQTLEFRNCATCRIDTTGLVADVKLYNPIEPKYKSKRDENYLIVDNVFKFRGNTKALQTSLNRYEQYPVVVPLILGSEIVVTANSLKQVPLPRILPLPEEVNPPIPPVNVVPV